MKLKMEQSGSLILNDEKEWPELKNGLIPTVEFLSAADTVVTFFEALGRLYNPVKADLEGNIRKLRIKYEKNPKDYEYLQSMILDEKVKGQYMATESLLWLKRGLYFIYLFLKSLIIDYEKGVKTESLMSNIRDAYNTSLRSYHNFLLRKLFDLLSRSIPNRTQLYASIVHGDSSPEVVIPKLTKFVDGLKVNLQAIYDFYADNNLDPVRIHL